MLGKQVRKWYLKATNESRENPELLALLLMRLV